MSEPQEAAVIAKALYAAALMATGYGKPKTAEATREAKVALDALVARIVKAERERDEWKEAAERFERCDCVPVIISSRSCPKCGRRGVAFESWLEMHKAAEARVAELEAVLREDAQAWEADSDGWARVRRYFESLPDVDLWGSKELVAALEGRVEAISERRAALAAAAGEPEAATP